jgi:ankyrin repeat protein
MKGRLNLCLLAAVVFILAAGCGSTQLQLWEASENGDTAAVQSLLAQGADVNAKEIGGGTALTNAAFLGHTDIVQALLAQGADVNAKNNENFTALLYAYRGRHNEIIRMLEKAAAK